MLNEFPLKYHSSLATFKIYSVIMQIVLHKEKLVFRYSKNFDEMAIERRSQKQGKENSDVIVIVHKINLASNKVLISST